MYLPEALIYRFEVRLATLLEINYWTIHKLYLPEMERLLLDTQATFRTKEVNRLWESYHEFNTDWPHKVTMSLGNLKAAASSEFQVVLRCPPKSRLFDLKTIKIEIAEHAKRATGTTPK